MQQMNFNRICAANAISIPIDDVKINPRLCKFVAIIQGKKEIIECCKEKKLVTWLTSKEAVLKEKFTDVMQYHNFIYPPLELTKKADLFAIQIRYNTALKYAKILEQHMPEDDGNINQSFNYAHLVSVIKKVFYNHIRNNCDLFTVGIELVVKNKIFFAKVETSQIYIIPCNPRSTLGQGSYGTVVEVYEIATRKFLALKFAPNIKSQKFIEREIFILKSLHKQAKESGISVEGFQAEPLATFNIQEDEMNKFVGFLGPKYGADVIEWSKGHHTNKAAVPADIR